jgi:hypothetical protein
LSPSTTNRPVSRWASTALDLPSKRPLYRLFASLGGFVIEATVFADGCRRYAVSVTLDGVHVPSSPAGGFPTFEGAVVAAKQTFTEWGEEILRRV